MQKKKTSIKDRIIWITLALIIVYMFILGIPEVIFGSLVTKAFMAAGAPDAVIFVAEYYIPTVIPFLGILIYLAIFKKNRPILKTFAYGYGNNNFKNIGLGLLVGFIMNGICIMIAILHQDIVLSPSFELSQIPFYIFALFFVFIQSASEEMWCRGFMYERANVHYPLWVAMVANAVIFGLLHIFNDGITVQAMIDLIACGVAFSLARWQAKSIWFASGIHCGWNFTQNFIFGLPNSGLVSQQAIFHLDAANARNNIFYDNTFGVEGGIPAIVMEFVLGGICLYLAYKAGRMGELLESKESKESKEAYNGGNSIDQ